ncbi:DAK2 domain-containing protein [Kribbella qitaiheensis]|uniref:DAK2 domain-containing protein n=1 Tax=Kribbella qitaiheensis TaxID=1544730 RepID=A0A7G6WUE1_9ACTN|nr:DAK2 domain-containing protein [Kribbella qitaiheensis]QNE17606.1 DAK2 domain-containing protein [Kribbella qitaiheensis]
MEELTVGVLRSWARVALAELGRARAEIDELNVYPVPDGDTGTNLYLTWEAACDALPEGELTFAEAVQAFGRGALLGARGNSGVITSQLVRACGLRLAENLPRDQEADAGSVLADPRMSEAAAFADALVFAADAAYGAVAKPVEGTMLTVARAAANGALAAANEGKALAEVCLAAVAAARLALTKTTEQLAVLRRAGVVDAGGAGLVVILGAMESVLSGRPPGEHTGVPRRVPATASARGASGPGVEASGESGSGRVGLAEGAGGEAQGGDLEPDGPAYEVMYLLDAPDDRIGDFRRALAGLGDSVVVVGGDELWNVHVHTDDVGAAIEQGIGTGRPHRIRVTHFADMVPHPPIASRAVIAVAAGDGLAKLFVEAGAVVVKGGPGRRCSTGELLAAIEQSGAPEIVILPNDKDSIAVAEAAATAARQDGIRVAVIRTRAQVQGLAAIAVHDPGRSFDDAVNQLSAAAGQTRHGAVTIAVKDAWTMAGTCRIGDALGVVDGDFALITEDLAAAATGVADRLLGGGGELMTVVRGEHASPELVDALVRHVRRNRKDVDVVVYDGGQERYPLLIGVE